MDPEEIEAWKRKNPTALKFWRISVEAFPVTRPVSGRVLSLIKAGLQFQKGRS